MCIAKCFNLFALLGFLYEDNRDLNIFLSFFVIIELLKKKRIHVFIKTFVIIF